MFPSVEQPLVLAFVVFEFPHPLPLQGPEGQAMRGVFPEPCNVPGPAVDEALRVLVPGEDMHVAATNLGGPDHEAGMGLPTTWKDPTNPAAHLELS